MFLYNKDKKGHLKQVKQVPFKLEKNVQQIFEDNLHQVAELVLEVVVGVEVTFYGKRPVVLSLEQAADVGIYDILLVLEVLTHFIEIGLEESFYRLSGTLWQHRRNLVEVMSNVWQTAVEVIVVRAQQIGHQALHGSAHELPLRRQIAVVAVYMADEEEKDHEN